MSIQANYKTKINEQKRQYNKFKVSRTVSIPSDDIIEMDIPAIIPKNFSVEVGLYSLSDNNLIYLADFPAINDIFEVKNLRYADGTTRRLMFINFARLDVGSVIGEYELVVNFFVDEIGSLQNPQLQITQISPSGYELQVQLLPEYRTQENIDKLKTFVTPQISKDWVLDAVKYICNQTQSLNPNIPTDRTALSLDIINEFLPESIRLQLNNPTLSTSYVNSIKSSTQDLLNTTYTHASQSIQRYIENETVFTDKLIFDILSSSLSTAFKNYQQKQEYKLL